MDTKGENFSMKTYLVTALAVVLFTTPALFAKGNGHSGNTVALQGANPDQANKRAEKKTRLEANKHERAQKAAEAKKAREEKIAERKAAHDKTEGADTDKKEKKSLEATKGQEIVDNREARQDKRIQHGINKGYLTADEITKLEAQQKSIMTLESSLTSDGKLSRQDFKQLTEELNTASHCIWGEKHDTDGKQMATYRFGSNVFAKNDLTAKMSDPNLSKAEARTICKNFHQMMDLKKQLSGNVSGADREKLQTQYDALLNQYFEVK